MIDAVLRHRRPAPDGEAGFTLVEVLVTLVLVGLLVSMISGALGQLAKLSSISKRNDASVELSTLSSYLVRSISNAQTLPLMAGSASRRILLAGTNNSVRFVALAKLGVRHQGIRDVSIFVERDGEQKRLVQMTMPRRFENELGAQERTVLAENIEAVTFEYLSRARTDQRSVSWGDEWNVSGELPAAIRIKIVATRLGMRIEGVRIAFLVPVRLQPT
jgi:prepilin-type N-terminal cleavage/methylation domain-containing protein